MNLTVPLSIQHLTKVYQTENGYVEALHDINFMVNPGEFVSIVGSSGCGKSTLLRIIVGLENNFQGNILLGDDLIKGTNVNRGMVFQEARLFPWLTVEQNIDFGLVNKYTKKEKKEIVETHIALVGLHGFAQSYPYQLSGGMQQRVSIARALVNNPKILTLDEPFGALDALTRIQMQQEILRIWEQEKTTMLLVTHDVDEAIYLADRVILLSSRPGTIKKIIPVNLPRPRDRSSYDFMRIKRIIYKELFDQDTAFLDYAI
ncbi:MAG: ABC transporter ATP-binding protein [Planctomycetaceae bacterium]|jgi:sulfonate transport system ATP-binding protein|nr:ABC transporter ATP-binding protein [Planctomycetaceae bacterium]